MTHRIARTLNGFEGGFNHRGEPKEIVEVDEFSKQATKTKKMGHESVVPIERRTDFFRLHFEDGDSIELKQDTILQLIERERRRNE